MPTKISTARTILQLAERAQYAWDRGDFEEITLEQAAKLGFEGVEADCKWYEFDTQEGWTVQALTNGCGAIECYALHDLDDEPTRFTLDYETGAITLP